jgi:hypothetical protein
VIDDSGGDSCKDGRRDVAENIQFTAIYLNDRVLDHARA